MYPNTSLCILRVGYAPESQIDEDAWLPATQPQRIAATRRPTGLSRRDAAATGHGCGAVRPTESVLVLMGCTRLAHRTKWIGDAKSAVDDEAVLHVFRP